MKRLTGLILTCGALSLIAVTANATPITITSSNVAAYASNNIGAVGFQQNNNTAFNTGATSLTAVDGLSSALTGINYVASTSYAELDFTFDQARNGAQGSHARSYGGIVFTANANTTYTLSGLYGENSITTAGRVLFDVDLYDITNDIYLLFFDRSESRNTANESFALGVAGDGDYRNNTFGSITGNLVAGNSYQLVFNNLIHAYPTSDGGATATGNLNLIIGSVPEPSTLILLGLGLIGFGFRRTTWGH